MRNQPCTAVKVSIRSQFPCLRTIEEKRAIRPEDKRYLRHRIVLWMVIECVGKAKIKGCTCPSARVACHAELRRQHALRYCLWRPWGPRAVSAQTSPIERHQRRSTRVCVRVSAWRMSGAGRARVFRRSAGASEGLRKLRRMEALLLAFFNTERTLPGTKSLYYTTATPGVEEAN